MRDSPQVYGTVTVGARGQVVIPTKVRKVRKIEPGDKLIVISGPPGRAEIISFIPVKNLSKFLQHFEERVSALKRELYKKEK